MYIINYFVKAACNFFVRRADQPLSEAVAAIHGAAVGRQNQRAFSVLVLHALAYGVARFAAGIKRPALIRLKKGGNTHPPNGIARIAPINQLQVIAGNGHREMRA